MTKNLVKHGNSWALILDRPILELLKIDPEAPVELSTDGEVLQIRSTSNNDRSAKFEQGLALINQRYHRVLKRLAE